MRIVVPVLASLVLAFGCQKKSSSDQAEPEATKVPPIVEPASAKAPPADVHAGVDRKRRPGASRFDKNGDGILDDAERADIINQRAARIMKTLDSDGDGQLTVAEIESAPGPMGRMLGEFKIVDTSADGKLSEDELRAAITERRLLRRKPVRPSGAGEATKR